MLSSSKSINKEFASYVSGLVANTETKVMDFSTYKTPVYSIDEEANGFPEDMVQLSKEMTNYDGYVVSLAEHNGSYSAAFKSILDWLSRVNREIFNNKPVLLMATSPGGRGGVSVLANASAYFPHAGASEVISFSLPKYFDSFKEGEIVNEDLKKSLLEKVSQFESKL